MSKDILSYYGPERSDGYRAKHDGSGGIKSSKDVHAYAEPRGPRNINDPKSPGLHGQNFGYCGSQGEGSLHSETSGGSGLGGSTGCCTQGRH